MKKHLTLVMTMIAFCLVFAAAQTARAQVTVPKNVQLPNTSQRAFTGTITAGSGTNLEQLAGAYKCGEITVQIGQTIKDKGFTAVQSGKVIGDIKDGKCSYFIPYDSKIPVKKYEIQFSAAKADRAPGCSKFADLTFVNAATIDYPKSDAKPVKVDATLNFVCKQIG